MKDNERDNGADSRGDAQAEAAAGDGGTAVGTAELEGKTAADAAFDRLNADDDAARSETGDGSGADKAPGKSVEAESPLAKLTKAQRSAAKELGLSDKDLASMDNPVAVLDNHARRVSTLAGRLGAESQKSKRYADAIVKLSQEANATPETGGDSSAPQIGEVTEDEMLDGGSAAAKLNANFKALEARLEARLQTVAASRREPENTVESVAERFFEGLDPDLYPTLVGPDADPLDRAKVAEDAISLVTERRADGRPVTVEQALSKSLPPPSPELLVERVVRKYAGQIKDQRGQAIRNPSGRDMAILPDPKRAELARLDKNPVWRD